MTRRVNTSVIVALLWLGACGAAGREGGAAAPVQAVRAVDRCSPDPLPARLPGAAALVDTAALGAALRELRRSGDAPAGRVVLSMGYQADGLNVRRDVIEHTLHPAAADTIQELVFAHRRSAAEAEDPWGVRLRIDLADDVSYDVARREYCPPRPRDRDLESAMHDFISTGVSYRGGSRSRTVLVRIRVHPAGYVEGGTVVRGDAPGSTLERDLVTYLRQFSFEPATMDGEPVHGEIDVPVRIRS